MYLKLKLIEHRKEPILEKYSALVLELAKAAEGTLPGDDDLVFAGEEYALELVPQSPSERELCAGAVTLCVNHEEIGLLESALLDDGSLRLRPESPRALFTQCLGFARLSLSLGGHELYSRLLSVMTGSVREKRNIEEILHYVSRHSLVLSENRLSGLLRDRALNLSSGGHSGLRQRLLQRIIGAYVRNLAFFRSSSACSFAVHDESVPLERARSLTQASLIYAMLHPDELTAVQGSAICAGGRSYLPKRVLEHRQILSRNTYENSVILSFIGSLCRMSRQSAPEAPALSFNMPGAVRHFVFSGSSELLLGLSSPEKRQSELEGSHESLLSVYGEYRTLLKEAAEHTLRALPPPSRKFLEVPQYKEIYELMRQWFSDAPEEEAQQSFLFNATAKNLWYEYYCLIKLCLCLCDHGLKLENSSSIDWHYSSRFYSKPVFDNRYDFVLDDASITLYYQPVLKNTVTSGSDLMLMRSSSWRFSGGSLEAGDPASFPVYTPDYVLKFTAADGHSGYLIIDAKYSTRDHAVKKRLPQALFKYQAAVSLASPDDDNLGVLLLCGKSPEADLRLHDVELSELSSASMPFHCCDVLQLNEDGSGFYDEERLSLAIMKRLEKYRSGAA